MHNPSAQSDAIDLSIIVGSYNMHRELPRTLFTLSRQYQRHTAGLRYEVLIADNGSTLPINLAQLMLELPDLPVRQYRVPAGNPSPVSLLNRAMRGAAGRLIALMIDGARMLSPGVLHHALLASRLHPRPVICVHGFHLGPDLQSRSVLAGYSQHREDELLASVPWREDGYRLLDISVFAGSSFRGWFVNPTESNCLIMPRDLWEQLNRLDERFITPGGGLVNLDIFKRACEAPGTQLIMLLGEGTFHQIHGGAATGQSAHITNPNEAFDREYQQIRGEVYRVPTYPGHFLGTLPPSAGRHLLSSAHTFQASGGFLPNRPTSDPGNRV